MSISGGKEHVEYILDGISGEPYDATDSVICYQNGKTMECECGHGVGVAHDTLYVRCAKCGNVIYDEEYEEREAPDVSKEQASLMDF